MLGTATHMFQNIDCIRIEEEFLCQRKISSDILPTQQQLSFFIIDYGTCVKYFQHSRVHGDIDVTKIKGSKQ